MKRKHLFVAIVVVGVVQSALSQGFVNLNFEQAVVRVNEPTYGGLDWGLAAPGWSHSSGSSTSVIYYQNEHLGMDQIYLLRDSTSPVTAPGALAGRYSLSFASGADVNGPVGPYAWISAYISQTGTIASDSRSIWMLATGPFQVLINGAPVSMVSMGGNSYAGDISGYAGSVSELKIVNTATWPHTYTAVDNILFSPVVVPEPCSFSILGLGMVLIFQLRRKDR